MKQVALLSLLCLVFVGCVPVATVDVTKTAQGFHTPTDPNRVEILVFKPDRSFLELATISTSNWEPSDTAKMYNALRAKAAPMGADAVVITNTGRLHRGDRFYLWSAGVAIKYK